MDIHGGIGFYVEIQICSRWAIAGHFKLLLRPSRLSVASGTHEIRGVEHFIETAGQAMHSELLVGRK